MAKNINFQMEEIAPDWLNDYPEDKFTVFKTCFLSTQKNSHNLDISAEVLKRDAKTILGNFLVAKLQYGDASTHVPSEIIYGYFPKEQDVEFEDTEDGNVKAWAYCVVGKQYGQEFNEIFDLQNLRNTSVEMKVKVADDADEGEVESFDIYGLTCLGLSIKGSCPDAMMTMIRFSQEDADAYFSKIHEHNLTPLKKFARERKNMESKKSYKLDKSKEAVSEKAWGDVDKADLRDKIIEASNRDALVKSVYMLVEEDWQNAPSEHLKYPVMCFDGDKLVYNRYGLASALAYAKQENETAVIKKIERIYKKLDIDNSDRKEDGVEKMSKEIEFAAVAISDMWDNLWKILCEKHPGLDGYGSIYHIKNIYEDNGQKFAIIVDDCCEYRLDFYFTEDGLTTSDEIVKVETEIVETDEVKRFAEPDDVEKYRNGDKHEDKDDDDDEEDAEEKMARLEKEIAEKDHIIMGKDGELEELRKFKQSVMESERAKTVESVMEEVKEYIDTESYSNLRNEGLMCEFSEIDAWTNKAKAMCFGAVKKSRQSAKENSNIWSFSAPTEIQHKKNSIWD